MLGSWYQTFAMANSRLSDAVSAMANVQAPSPLGASGPAETWQSVLSAYRTQSANSTDATTIGQPPASGQAASASGSSSSLFRAVFSSPGQSLIKAMTTSGSGDNGQMNPLIRMKNMGDYLMGMAETSLGVVIGLQVVNELKNGWSVAGIAAKIGNLATGIGDGYTGIFKAIYPYLFLMILSLFVFGVTLSIYLPMVPFVVWFGAVINWLVVVAEGIVAAPLWAIAHLGVDGEGLGQRSMHGYLFLLNMCIRPFLMVIGFFVGGGLLQVGGTFLTDGFSVAVANSQFDSVTGIFSVLGYFWLFIQLCLTLVHNCFNLIVLLPDQVIAWVGGYAAGQLGYNAEKISHGFDSGKDKAGHTHERGASQSQQQAGRALPGGNGMTG
jgi:conjugal transfer/type IV secretion protein DotA/TraY